MVRPAHSKETKEFMELSFAQQAKSITAQINNLSKAMLHHAAHAKDGMTARKKCLGQVERMLDRLKDDWSLQ